MRTASFSQTRVIALIAAGSAAAVAVFIIVAGPSPSKIAPFKATPGLLGSAPAAEAPAGSSGLGGPPAAPVEMQARLEPPPVHPSAREELSAVFPPPQMPGVATAEGAGVSLACLAKNGADLSKPMPSKHHLFAADERIAARMQAWGQAHGFEVRNAETIREHTGTPRFAFDLVRVEVPAAAQIEREGRLILAAVRQTPGTYYQTWSGEIDR